MWLLVTVQKFSNKTIFFNNLFSQAGLQNNENECFKSKGESSFLYYLYSIFCRSKRKKSKSRAMFSGAFNSTLTISCFHPLLPSPDLQKKIPSDQKSYTCYFCRQLPCLAGEDLYFLIQHQIGNTFLRKLQTRHKTNRKNVLSSSGG